MSNNLSLEQSTQTINSPSSRSLPKLSTVSFYYDSSMSLAGELRMSIKLIKQSKQIVVSLQNYGLIKNYGRASDSFNEAITELLWIASREGENPHRGII
jgi:hypothetical protein